MADTHSTEISSMIDKHGRTRSALMDIMRDVQATFGGISRQTITQIAAELQLPRVEVESFVSFYAFLSQKPKGKIVIRVCDDVVDRMKGYDRVLNAFRTELGIEVGETTDDGLFSLETTACIGMCDQAPAALFNHVPVTELSSDKAREYVQELRAHGDPRRLVKSLGDGNNGHELVQSMVKNNIREPGPLVLSPYNRGEAVHKALSVSPQEVTRAVKAARLRGRGGAGFPTGMKWEFARAAPGEMKFIICNADEGEPGTFKDRVILTERPDRIFAGMTIAGYAIGASQGILYLRGEYEYLRPFLDRVLQERRDEGLLGASVCGHQGFDFDIRIQMGAGAYICGEETALISSCEGRRGDPKTRPPFPAQKGFLDCPSVINNVETLCCVTKILEIGPASFAEFGSPQSTGTKLLSVSGDCRRTGVYELPFGITLRQLLHKVGADDAQAVQVGGPSGQMIPPDLFDRTICYDDLATGGAITIFGPGRNLLDVVRSYMHFFADESCGYCTPCRVGNVLLGQYLQRMLAGRGEPDDLAQMKRIARSMKTTSRCGLGQTSCNPVLSTLQNFPSVYQAAVSTDPNGFRRSFDLGEAVADAERIIGRRSVHLTHDSEPLDARHRQDALQGRK